jgi:hypothetical protein
MAEKYEGRADGGTYPARHGFAVATSDSVDLPNETRAIYVGAAGDVSVVLASGEAVVLAGVSAGSLLPIRVSRVNVTGTTASLMVGLY